jgi:hypothetical protein
MQRWWATRVALLFCKWLNRQYNKVPAGPAPLDVRYDAVSCRRLIMDPRTRVPEPPDAESVAQEKEKEKEDERLDEELDETFPASDPVPFQHDA